MNNKRQTIIIFALLSILLIFSLAACNKPTPKPDPTPAINGVICKVINDINESNNLCLDDSNTVFRTFNTPITRGCTETMDWFADIHSLNFVARDTQTGNPYLIQANFNAVREPITRNNIFTINDNYDNVPKTIDITKVSDVILDSIRKIDGTTTNELFKCRDENYSEIDFNRGKIIFIKISDTFISEDSIGGNTYISFDIFSLITYNTHLEAHAPQTTEFEKITTVSTILTQLYQEDLLLAVADFFNAVQLGNINNYSISEKYSCDHYAGFINGYDISRNFIKLTSSYKYENAEQVKNMSDDQLIEEVYYQDKFPISDFYIADDFGIALEKGETMTFTRLNSVSSVESAKNEVINMVTMRDPKTYIIDFIGENEYYYQFKLKHNSKKWVDLWYTYRVLVFKDSMLHCTFNNSVGSSIEIKNLKRDIVLNLLDLEAYFRTLGRVIYRELTENNYEYIYTYYEVSITYGDWGLMDTACLHEIIIQVDKATGKMTTPITRWESWNRSVAIPGTLHPNPIQ